MYRIMCLEIFYSHFFVAGLSRGAIPSDIDTQSTVQNISFAMEHCRNYAVNAQQWRPVTQRASHPTCQAHEFMPSDTTLCRMQ